MPSTEARRHAVALLLVAAGTVGLAGCMSMPAPAYQPGIANTERLIGMPAGRVAVGAFDAAPGVDRPLNVRGSLLQGGADGTFAGYIRDALASELTTAARLDAASGIRIGGTLLHNDLSAATAGGSARIRLRFTVERDGVRTYEREISVVHGWESSFIGAIAVPAAMDQYAAAVQQLIGALLDDPAFRQAIAPAR